MKTKLNKVNKYKKYFKKGLKLLISLLLSFSLLLTGVLSKWSNVWFFTKIEEVKAGSQEYTSGSANFTASVTGDHIITLVGGGGGGGGPPSTFDLGGGGGGGGGLCQVTVALTQGNSYAYAVGTAGTAGAGNGGSGGNTTFTVGGTTYQASGGGGGLDYDNGATGGSGGGTVNCGAGIANTGGTGATGGSGSGGGGSGAGTGGNGNSGSIPTGGAAVANYGGKGGNGSTSRNGSGSAGEAYGGGGGGGNGRNGSAAAGYAGYIYITWADNTTFTQNTYRWYVDNDLTNPTDPWSSATGVDLAENTAITVVPFAYDPPSTTQELRLRVNFTVGTANMAVSTRYFKLQYRIGTDSDCSTGSWTDVNSGNAWEYATSTVTDGADITASLSNTTSGKGQEYVKSRPSQINHVAVNVSEITEYDFHIIGTTATTAERYLFRVVETDSGGTATTAFTAYTNCPILSTEPDTSNLMRHGRVFTGGSERGFYWAN